MLCFLSGSEAGTVFHRLPCIVLYKDPDDAKQRRTYCVSRISLEGVQKNLKNFIALIRDKCGNNQCIANKLGKPLIGCGNRQFQLSVREAIAEEVENFTSV